MECEQRIWWPFTQHAHLPHHRVGVVDARAGESYDMLLQNLPKSSQGPSPESPPVRGQAPPKSPHLVNTGDVQFQGQSAPHAPKEAAPVVPVDAASSAHISPNAPGFGGNGKMALAAHYDGCASWWTQVGLL